MECTEGRMHQLNSFIYLLQYKHLYIVQSQETGSSYSKIQYKC